MIHFASLCCLAGYFRSASLDMGVGASPSHRLLEERTPFCQGQNVQRAFMSLEASSWRLDQCSDGAAVLRVVIVGDTAVSTWFMPVLVE